MDLCLSQILHIQQELYELHKKEWNPRKPEFGKDHILYMVEEIGETIAILKKKGHEAIMEDAAVREAFLGELSDILMYYSAVLLCFQVSPEEFTQAFQKIHARNMGRDYTAEYKELYHG